MWHQIATNLKYLKMHQKYVLKFTKSFVITPAFVNLKKVWSASVNFFVPV